MNVLDLFSGIGGFSLGLERAGMRTVAFCEIDPFARRVLAKHWPDVPCYDDVRTLTAARLRADGIAPDVICGGFPCQDISQAGTGAGLDGARSGLWSEYARIIGELRPRFVIVENVAVLLSRGLGRVLGDLDTLGYDAEWHCIQAAAVGAPHLRDRVWILAHSQHPDAYSERPHRAEADAAGQGGEVQPVHQQICEPGSLRAPLADSNGLRKLQSEGIIRDIRGWAGDGGWWVTEPAVGRVADGVPNRVDRLRSLGNAVVPQIPEIIGRAIMSHIRADVGTGSTT